LGGTCFPFDDCHVWQIWRCAGAAPLAWAYANADAAVSAFTPVGSATCRPLHLWFGLKAASYYNLTRWIGLKISVFGYSANISRRWGDGNLLDYADRDHAVEKIFVNQVCTLH
jgi:hypothetical protein